MARGLQTELVMNCSSVNSREEQVETTGSGVWWSPVKTRAGFCGGTLGDFAVGVYSSLTVSSLISSNGTGCNTKL